MAKLTGICLRTLPIDLLAVSTVNVSPFKPRCWGIPTTNIQAEQRVFKTSILCTSFSESIGNFKRGSPAPSKNPALGCFQAVHSPELAAGPGLVLNNWP